MHRRHVLKIASMATIGIPAWRSLSVAATQKDQIMLLDRKSVENLTAGYTVAWNSDSPQNVAAYFAENSEMVINRGERGVGVRVSPRWRPGFSRMFQA